jgi:cell division protein FtsQ
MRLPRLVAAHPRIAGGVVLALVLLAGAYLLVRDSSLVRVEQVTIAGAGGPEGPRVRAALDQAAREMTTLHVRRGALMDAVQRYPTVRGLVVERDLPHTLRITVLRRPAVAMLAAGAQRVPVAADGTLLRGVPAPDDIPSVKVAAPPAGSTLRDPRAEKALALVAAAPDAMRAHVSRVFLGRQGLQADLRNGPAVILGDGSRLRAKWIAAARVLGDPGAKGATYVDVRLPDRAVAGGLPEAAQPAQPSTEG